MTEPAATLPVVVSRRNALVRLGARVRAVPHIGTLTGLLFVVAGFVLLVVAWGETAGLTNVGKQMPWFMSAGLTGIGLVIVGLTFVALDAKQRDAAARRERSEELHELLSELRTLVEGQP
ncbi:MAG TPA: hypothetical protein VHE83_15445 [Mycobacteriales bacterium]|nr:hypothetical protein [Mycobacteriales bacterium]